MKRLYLLLYLLMPVIVTAQTGNISDSIKKADCDGKIFRRVETLPSIKGGKTALSDSLLAYLNTRNVVITDGKSIFSFLITTKSQIFDLFTAKPSGNFQLEAVFKEGLIAHSNMWIPAVQNYHKVCAMISLEVEFAGGKMAVKIKNFS